MIEITEGMELYWPPTRYSNERFVKVAKVGRKWLTLSNGARAERVSLRVEPGTGTSLLLYLSKDDYDAKIARRKRWGEVRQHINEMHTPPSDVDIEAIARLLGMHP